MTLNEADTRAKLIDPAIHKRGWTEDLIRREETAGTVEIINGKARRRSRGKIDYDYTDATRLFGEGFITKPRRTGGEGPEPPPPPPPPEPTIRVDGFDVQEFLLLLPTRAESDLSWTLDMEERKRVASETARPLKEQATAKSHQAAQWSQRVADLKKAKARDDQAIEEAEAKDKQLTRESRDQAAKAKVIEDAVYDLKAVNPHKKPVVDTRTPEELMNIIEAKGQEVADALAALRVGANDVPLL